jgi:COX assembly protein 1
MIYACRQPRLVMNACMLQYQNQDELDKARSEWFELAEERQKARAEHKRKLADARDKHKEWWNLDDSGRLQGKVLEKDSEAGITRREENKVDSSGVRRGGVWGGT